VIFVDILGVPINICMKFYTTVQQVLKNTTKFGLIVSKNANKT